MQYRCESKWIVVPRFPLSSRSLEPRQGSESRGVFALPPAFAMYEPTPLGRAGSYASAKLSDSSALCASWTGLLRPRPASRDRKGRSRLMLWHAPSAGRRLPSARGRLPVMRDRWRPAHGARPAGRSRSACPAGDEAMERAGFDLVLDVYNAVVDDGQRTVWVAELKDSEGHACTPPTSCCRRAEPAARGSDDPRRRDDALVSPRRVSGR
jgi:hypothetical protein